MGLTQVPIEWVLGFFFFFCVGKKWLGNAEFNHSPHSSAEIKNEWSYTSAPPLCFLGVIRENCFVFLLFLLPHPPFHLTPPYSTAA